MSAPPEATEPSRTSEPEPEQERKWVALLSIPVILEDDDNDRDMVLELDDPPRPSRLLVRNRCHRDPRRLRDTDPAPSAFILAAAADRSARLLVQFGEGGIVYLFDADPSARTVTRLPRVPSSLREKSLDLCADRSIGLIAHPHSPTHFVVAQLHPGRKFLYYSTFTNRWNDRQLSQPQGRTRDPSSEHGVVAHDGRLWWLSLAYGLFFCDPLGIDPLRFVPLPAGCELGDDIALNPGTNKLVKQRRCISASEGKLRFVEIGGLSYDVDEPEAEADATVKMWTLVDPDGPEPWEKVEYEVPFAEIWEDNSYRGADLPRRIPDVAFVDPDNHAVVYFLYGSKLFGFDARKRRFVACEEGYGADQEQYHRRIVDAWKLSPPTTPMQHAFPRGTHLRLRATDEFQGYVEARDNGRDVVLGTWETMPHTAWIVDYVQREGKPEMLLQSSANGRYLAHTGVMDRRTVSATVTMVDYFDRKQEELYWKVEMGQSIVGDEGRLVNAKFGVWNVSADTVWRFETILATPTPPRPRPPPVMPQEYHGWRKILLFQANDAGEFNKDYGDQFPFVGSSLPKLRIKVQVQQQLLLINTQFPGLRQPHVNNPLCVWPGSCGRLTPLVTDLPHSDEPMDIVVLSNGSPAAEALRYSSLDEA